ncbi:AraC family transcriptional regulator [Roseateles koreensis]|uniref:Helix-turn-helix transcriptional regulator n=1 Tax=Roseateles koreensis TaxID=2987526 RepID=A0ABT5KN32_9BURK|nr:helix-turn-helix transcriptional regulator [Roseateles koreensis]MDC8783773.1 helix-turn-helix transcriptional regulator [Roseateles koreensis]
MPTSQRRHRTERISLPPLDPQRYAPTPERPVRAKSRVLAHHEDIHAHHHGWGQLVFSISGVVRVSTERATYLVPPSRAVWIPPGVIHAVTAIEQVHLRTLYLHQHPDRIGPGLPSGTVAAAAWADCRVMEVSPLLRELVLQLAQLSHESASEREHWLASLIEDELRRANCLRLGIDLPQDKRLRRFCEALLQDPQRHADLEGWAAEVGASTRTISRLFRQELGSSYVQWRQQVLLARALTLAARRQPMGLIAAELGYASASAFSAMVTRTVGMPPSRFFAEA